MVEVGVEEKKVREEEEESESDEVSGLGGEPTGRVEVRSYLVLATCTQVPTPTPPARQTCLPRPAAQSQSQRHAKRVNKFAGVATASVLSASSSHLISLQISCSLLPPVSLDFRPFFERSRAE